MMVNKDWKVYQVVSKYRDSINILLQYQINLGG
jgi:hypothetical protein